MEEIKEAPVREQEDKKMKWIEANFEKMNPAINYLARIDDINVPIHKFKTPIKWKVCFYSDIWWLSDEEIKDNSLNELKERYDCYKTRALLTSQGENIKDSVATLYVAQ